MDLTLDLAISPRLRRRRIETTPLQSGWSCEFDSPRTTVVRFLGRTKALAGDKATKPHLGPVVMMGRVHRFVHRFHFRNAGLAVPLQRFHQARQHQPLRVCMIGFPVAIATEGHSSLYEALYQRDRILTK